MSTENAVGRPRDEVARLRAAYLAERHRRSGLPLTDVVRELCRATGRKERPTYEAVRAALRGGHPGAALLPHLEDALEALGA
jgi:hypothetical protein